MMEIKAGMQLEHPVHGQVTVIQRSAILIQICTEDCSEFWVPATSFAQTKPKTRAKKTAVKKIKKRIHKADEVPHLVEELAVRAVR